MKNRQLIQPIITDIPYRVGGEKPKTKEQHIQVPNISSIPVPLIANRQTCAKGRISAEAIPGQLPTTT